MVIFYPLWVAFLVIFIRKLATPGYRLKTAGFICIFQGCGMLLAVLAGFALGKGNNAGMYDLIYSAIGILFLSAGLYFGLRRTALT